MFTPSRVAVAALPSTVICITHRTQETEMATIVFAASVDDTMFPIAVSGFEDSERIVSVERLQERVLALGNRW